MLFRSANPPPSSYTLFQGGLPTALFTIPLRDAVWPLTFMLAHKAVPDGCRHLLFTTMCSTIPTSPDSGFTSRCGWTVLYREDPHMLCFREACQRPSLPSLFGMPYGHSLSCLLIRRYHMSAVTFCLLLCVPRYQLAQTPVSPHGAAGQQKQTPPPLPL